MSQQDIQSKYVAENFLNNKDFFQKLSKNNFVAKYEWSFYFIFFALFFIFPLSPSVYLLYWGLISLICSWVASTNFLSMSYITKVRYFKDEEFKQVKTRNKVYLGVIKALKGVWIFFIPYALLRMFIIDYHFIPSESMLPNLKVGNLVWVDKLKTTYNKNDVIVFDSPFDSHSQYIKRIVATEGDTIELNNNQVTLNGKAISDPVVSTQEYKAITTSDNSEGNTQIGSDKILINVKYNGIYHYYENDDSVNVLTYPLTKHNGKEIHILPACGSIEANAVKCIIPKDHYFVLGDNRGNSLDSRYWGLVRKSDIHGVVNYKNFFRPINN